MNNDRKLKLFGELAAEARGCLICPKMRDKTAVLSELNGNISPRVMFIAEAPGRQGADRTRRPFWGDKSGENFQALLDSIGLNRDDVFITNSVMCSPRSESGANRRPSKAEMRNCADFLRRQIELIDPTIVATLGSVALEAVGGIARHGLSLKQSAATVNDWFGRRLVPLYHPSPQVIITVRNLESQKADFAVLRSAIESGEWK